MHTSKFKKFIQPIFVFCDFPDMWHLNLSLGLALRLHSISDAFATVGQYNVSNYKLFSFLSEM